MIMEGLIEEGIFNNCDLSKEMTPEEMIGKEQDHQQVAAIETNGGRALSRKPSNV